MVDRVELSQQDLFDKFALAMPILLLPCRSSFEKTARNLLTRIDRFLPWLVIPLLRCGGLSLYLRVTLSIRNYLLWTLMYLNIFLDPNIFSSIQFLGQVIQDRASSIFLLKRITCMLLTPSHNLNETSVVLETLVYYETKRVLFIVHSFVLF